MFESKCRTKTSNFKVEVAEETYILPREDGRKEKGVFLRLSLYLPRIITLVTAGQ